MGIKKLSEAQERYLRDNYTYCPESGYIRGLQGGILLATSKEGYRVLRFSTNGRKYVNMPQHRLAFFLMTGRWPTIIDHINRCKYDNRWSNLREVTASENAKNTVACKSPELPVGVRKDRNKWRASISVDGKNRHIGNFNTMQEAVEARARAETIYR